MLARRSRAIVLGSACAGAILLAACGSRGPLDVEVVQVVSASDASPPLDAESLVDAADAASDAPVDAGHDATLVDCATCLTQQCNQQILQCVQSAACRATFQCAVQQCFAGGNANPQCLLNCASDPQGASGALGVFSCVTLKCGSQCTSVLGGGLGGLGGLGGGGGGGRHGDGG